MKFGYARVSTQDQSLSLQLDAIEKYGVERIFEEKESGKKKGFWCKDKIKENIAHIFLAELYFMLLTQTSDG